MMLRSVITFLIFVTASTAAQAKDSISITIQDAYLQFIPRGMVAPECESHMLQGNKFVSCKPTAGLWLIRDKKVYAVNGSALGYLKRMQSVYGDFSELPPRLKTVTPGNILNAIDSGIVPSEPLVWTVVEDSLTKVEEEKYCLYQREKYQLSEEATRLLGDYPDSSNLETYTKYDKKRRAWIEPRLEKLEIKHYGSIKKFDTAQSKMIESRVDCS